MTTDALILGDFAACTESLGPGKRAVVWVRGCSLKCKGCTTPQLIPQGTLAEHGVPIDKIVEKILEAKREHGIEGVSFSGGEPFEQAEALAAIARACHTAGLTVISWSGYALEELRASELPGVADLLAELDVLIDGRYVRSKRASLPLRGSSNQRIHLLTGTYADHVFDRCDVEFRVAPDGNIRSIGIIDDRDVRDLMRVFGID